MESPRWIIDIEDLLSTYEYFIPKTKILQAEKWLPLEDSSRLSCEFAYLLGKSFGDGHLDKRFTFKHSGEKENQEQLKYFLIETFDLSDSSVKLIENKYSKGSSTILQVNNSIFGRILYTLGAPIGNKTKQSFLVPTWIIENKENSRSFLRGILEDELSTIKIRNKTHSSSAMLKMTKRPGLIASLREFLEEIGHMLESLDIECSEVSGKTYSKKEQKTQELYLLIHGNKKNILQFRDNIGFRLHKRKINELENCCKIIENSLLKEDAGDRI
ncbi:TPA: hypothetical protein HA239_04795 [Candidatus Woesearchaeota archaeon]|nr:Peptidase S16, Lon-like protein protease [archaeon GW2011_AR15]MBS3104049.1 hypothetical protein [Candidatus Woesearchaeota archaeon]HIH41703.1 hypothetical protein [Candidatus Woesearchaeota archaeon]